MALRGIPLLAVAAALGCALGLAATELPWGALDPKLTPPAVHAEYPCLRCIKLKSKPILSPEVGYSLVDQLRGYTMDRENNCIVEQVDIISL